MVYEKGELIHTTKGKQAKGTGETREIRGIRKV